MIIVDTSDYTDTDYLMVGEVVDYILDQNSRGDSVIIGFLGNDDVYDSDGLEKDLIEHFEAKPGDRTSRIVKDFVDFYIRGLMADGNSIYSISTMLKEGF